MKLGICVAVSLVGAGIVGYMGFAAEQTNAESSKETAGGPTRDAVDASPELAVEELESRTENTEVAEQVAREVFRAFREHLAGGDQPSRGVSVQSVEMSGGTLSILDTGDGVIRVVAFAMDQENPNLEAAQGIAFSAVITKESIEVSSVDREQLARFVGKGRQASAAAGADGGVPDATEVALGPCTTSGDTTCCIVVTDTHFCKCCVSSNSGGCRCFQVV